MYRKKDVKIFSIPEWSNTSTKTYDLTTVEGREQVPINLNEIKDVCYIYIRENNEYYRLISDTNNGTTRTLIFNGPNKITITKSNTVMTVEFSAGEDYEVGDTDTTLTLSGVPADAKATGDAIDVVKNDLSHVYDNYLGDLVGTNGTWSGVTFTWDNAKKTVKAVGTATAQTFANIFVSYDNLINGLSAGDIFQLLITKSTTLGMRIGFYVGDTTVGAKTYFNNAIIKIPDNATGMYIRANVSSGVTVNDTMHYAIVNSTKKYLKLADKEYTLENIELPENMCVEGCGNSTLLTVTDNTAYGFKMVSGCVVKNLKLVGYNGMDWTPNGTITNSHGITISTYGATEDKRNRIKIEGVEICGFSGGAIHSTSTGVNYDNSSCITNCYLHNNNVGVYFPLKSEYNKCVNVSSSRNHIGCVNNGGNNLFSNCGFNGNVSGLIMDSTGITNPNSSHGSFVGCNFNHTHAFGNNTPLYAIQLTGQDYGELFIGCTIGEGHIKCIDSVGIVFNACNLHNNCTLTAEDGGLILFNGCVFRATTFTNDITGTAVVKYDNCYLYDGTVFDPTV